MVQPPDTLQNLFDNVLTTLTTLLCDLFLFFDFFVSGKIISSNNTILIDTLKKVIVESSS